MKRTKIKTRVFESEKEVYAYNVGYEDAMADADTGYSEADMEEAEDNAYQRGYNEALEQREENPDSNRIVKTMMTALSLNGGHWEYTIEKAIVAGDEKALTLLITELEKLYGEDT